MKFRDIAHLYIGCKFQVMGTNKIATFDFYCREGEEPIGTYELVKADYDFDKIKPILRAVTDVKIEELEHLESLIPISSYYHAHLTAYFLSCHFDLFGLIESGEAIDANTIPNIYP